MNRSTSTHRGVPPSEEHLPPHRRLPPPFAVIFGLLLWPVASLATEDLPATQASESQGQDQAEEVEAETPTALVIDMRENVSEAPESADISGPESGIVVEYLTAIAEMESTGGAYAPGLTEQLLGLGTTLQQLNRHEEAIDVLKRGVHLSRINTGLYSDQQIALLRSEIRSHMALGDFDTVDERQRYLYRVERQSLSTSEASTDALLRQADWQRQAYLAGVGDPETSSGRLILMWDLYRMALNEAIEVHGRDAPELRPALIGMLKSQYLIAGYQGFNDLNATNSNQLRTVVYNSDSYKRGESVLKALLDLNIANNATVNQHVRDIISMGDWAWWFGNRAEGSNLYAEAIKLIPEVADPDALYEELFGLPTPLPTIAGIEPLPEANWNDQGTLVVQFNVSETGRVRDLERLSEPQVDEPRVISRLLRVLRNTRFRPRFDDGMPVETEGLVWSWDLEDVESPALAMTDG